jgi:hypothetical protein
VVGKCQKRKYLLREGIKNIGMQSNLVEFKPGGTKAIYTIAVSLIKDYNGILPSFHRCCFVFIKRFYFNLGIWEWWIFFKRTIYRLASKSEFYCYIKFAREQKACLFFVTSSLNETSLI